MWLPMHQTKMKELDDSSLQVMIFLAVSLCAKAMALFLPGKTSAQAGFCQCCSEAFGAAVPGGSHACRHHLAEDPGSVTVCECTRCCWTLDSAEESEARKDATDGDGASSQQKASATVGHEQVCYIAST